MKESEKSEIINYMNKKYQENVPSIFRRVIKKRIKKIENFSPDELPSSLRSCTVEELLDIVQEGIKKGEIKF